ncbi:TonB-dependent receptor [Pseudoalteromonas denitrificans]|uniref:Iron complex outermembrane recepter protein n=1 Tax=Pseudoalteromonas denitrificans DSM 6059 TaxID=1123010 RepID=A0A1I1I1C1_9GAMM|nr:TonB-dependent receptor [Pseudoalteromonas denitrificans]SFC29891.1 iron complex outermembrane recepter protein [Pseudoalteromonas denitrificans DSM 6059]
MLNNKLFKISKLALVIGSFPLLFMPNVQAADGEEEIERIEVTGSSIKRTDIEGALPITTISADDITKSGVTSVPDLIAQLPSMQGFTTAADSVGGSGGGVQSASLRDLGEEYTLVLLNGRRMASSDSGGTIDLSSIPLAAIKRVEVLTDGASAIYGSDAIAGVVNFIMKDDMQDFIINARYDKPEETGGESFNVSLSGGFGDLGSDSFNVMFAYSHDEQDRLKSVDRDFSKTGILPFTHNDNEYILVQGSANAGPGNAYLSFFQYNPDGSIKMLPELDADGNETGNFTQNPHYATRNFNPYREANGQCGPNSAPSGTTCMFDYTSTLEIFPETTRDNVFLQGIVEINDNMQTYVNASWSRFEMITRIAPYPTGGFGLPLSSQLVTDEIMPHLSNAEKASLAKVTARWRVLPGGNRTSEWSTDTLNATWGIEGDIGDVTYDVAVTYADSERDETRLTGYPIEAQFMPLVTSGAVNVFGTFDSLSDTANQQVKDSMYGGPWEKTETELLSFEAKASMPVFELEEGDVYIGFGFDYREAEYTRRRSQANSDAIILFEAPTDEFDFSRETYGMFIETIIPVFEGFEVTAAVRYDNIGAVTDHDRTSGQVVNKDENDTTYKLSASYRPDGDWLLRASIGTGFKSATMKEIASPREDFGVTSGNFDCPVGLAPALAALCFPESFQYQVWREGNPDLKPETSEQISAGFVYAPGNDFSFSMDYWSVDLEDQVTRLTEAQIFGDAVLYADLFTTKPNLGTGEDDLAIIQSAVNIGKSENSGVDWAINLTTELSMGTLKSSVTGTYMIESKRLRSGTTTNQFDTSLGKFGSDDEVTFRVITQINNTLTMGDFAHTINLNYRSGYQDQLATGGDVRLGSDISTNAPDIQLSVSSFIKFDYLTTYFYNDNFNMGFGIKNLFDKQPPLSLRTSGAGHQVGYDPRYVDVLGRTFYISAEYTF